MEQRKLDPETRRKYEEARRRIGSKLKPHIEAIKESERITAEDLAVRINCKE